ncbi:MAG: hypothetical protein AAF958_14035 [Planctomycetota bacterium]
MLTRRPDSSLADVDWSVVLSLLEDDDRRAALLRKYPVESRRSFLSALRDLDPPLAVDVLAAGRKFDTASKLVDWPTVAVAGMLNSGKTSLVATFLSPQGVRRTLRGAANDQGTHRFVLWLPSLWKKQDELWSLLMDRIRDSIGGDLEFLADDPAAAHQQYSNREGDAQKLAVPLVATDPALDQVGVGLLDCPDIVSDEAFCLGSPEVRRSCLARAATLCSAFLVVASAESSRDSSLGELLRIASDLMPGVPRMLAVNKVRPRQTPDQVLDAFSPMAATYGIDTVYAAYDFEIPASSPFMPRINGDARSGVAVKSDVLEDEADLPTFFSVVEDPENNPPATISADRLLAALPQRLDRGELFRNFHDALAKHLREVVWQRGVKLLRDHAETSVRTTRESQQGLLDAALEFFARKGFDGKVEELRLLQNERVVRQLADSFIATAPWYARWGVRVNARLRGVVDGVTGIWRNLTPTAMAKRTAKDIEEKLVAKEYGDMMNPERLARAIDRYVGPGRLPAIDGQDMNRSGDLLAEVAEAAILRFERDGVSALDPRRLDAATRDMWAQVPTHKKLVAGLTPLATALAAFGGVLMIPIDFGAQAFACASISELFAAAGLSAIMAFKAGNQSLRDVSHQAARVQLSDFHAVLCDSFGICRPQEAVEIEIAGRNETLPPSEITIRPPNDVAATHALDWFRKEFDDELRKVLPR